VNGKKLPKTITLPTATIDETNALQVLKDNDLG